MSPVIASRPQAAAGTLASAAQSSLAGELDRGHIAEIRAAGASIVLTMVFRDNAAIITSSGSTATIATQVNGWIAQRGSASVPWPFMGPAQPVSPARPAAPDERAVIRAKVRQFVHGIAGANPQPPLHHFPAFRADLPLFMQLLANI